MTQATLAAPVTTTEQSRKLAKRLYEASVAEGTPLQGSDLGPKVGRSASWGRQWVREYEAAAAAKALAAAEPVTAAVVEDRAPAAPAVEAAALAPTAAVVPPAIRRITTVAVVVVALVAAAASYEHQRMLAEAAGEEWRARLFPLSVDGLIVAASMTMLVRRRAGLPVGALTWLSLLLGLGVSVAANVAAADPATIDPVLLSRLVAAWPPVALLLAHEMLLGQHRH